jgi:hypothetical protein
VGCRSLFGLSHLVRSNKMITNFRNSCNSCDDDAHLFLFGRIYNLNRVVKLTVSE